MLIRRGRHQVDFTILPNATLRDDRLSYTARGILAEILSRPDGWETSADRLSDRARLHRGQKRGEGRRALRAAFAELEAAGYIHRVRHQDDRGRWRTVMVVFDSPQHRGTANRTSVHRTSVNGRPVGGTSLRSTDDEGSSYEASSEQASSRPPRRGGAPSASAERARARGEAEPDALERLPGGGDAA